MKYVIVVEDFSLAGKHYVASEKLQAVPESEVENLLKRELIAQPEESEEEASPSPLETALVEALRPHVSETGQSESAVDTLKRIIQERETAQTQCKTLQSQLQGVQSQKQELQNQLTQEQTARKDEQQAQTEQSERLEVVASQVSGSVPFERKSEETPLQSLERYAQSLQGQTNQLADQRTQQAEVARQQAEQEAAQAAQAKAEQEVAQNQEQPTTGTPVTAAELSEATTAPVALALLNAGFDTKEKLLKASDEELKAIDGLGDKMLAKVRELAKS